MDITRGNFDEYPGSEILDPNQSSEIEINIKGAVEITAQFKNFSGTNTSIKVFPSVGLEYTTDPIKEETLCYYENKIIKVDVGYYTLKFQLNNNDLNNSTKVDYMIIVKK